MINSAIDGHVGSGKSTLAKGLAKILGYHVLDTGAIYRGLACAYKEAGNPPINEGNIAKYVKNVDVKLEFEGDLQRVIVNGKDYTPFLRSEETSLLTSKIAPYQVLRNKVLAIQRDFAKKYNCIIEGRDIGTVVLPEANVKFFVTANEEVRAQRRLMQLQDKNISFEEVLKDLQERDYKDEHRQIAPLKPAKDSIIIDNTNMNLEETISYCEKLIDEKLAKSN